MQIAISNLVCNIVTYILLLMYLIHIHILIYVHIYIYPKDIHFQAKRISL